MARSPKMSVGRPPRCSGTVEDYRELTFDVRDRALRNIGLLGLPPGYVSSNRIAWPWIRQIRTGWEGLEITLQNGRTEQVGLVTVACGFAGSRFRLECPRCRRRVCKLYHLDARLICRKCAGLWYAAQRTSSKTRKYLAMDKSAASSATTVNSGRRRSRQSRAACGGGPMSAIVWRWPASSGAFISPGADTDTTQHWLAEPTPRLKSR